jgi:hypothetical protein
MYSAFRNFVIRILDMFKDLKILFSLMVPIPKHSACKLRRCEYACKIGPAHNGSALTLVS